MTNLLWKTLHTYEVETL